MNLRAMLLGTVGCALVATSLGACYVIVVGEIYSWLIVGVFVGGLVAGGWPLALAAFRLVGASEGWPSVRQASMLVGAGVFLVLGTCGSMMLPIRGLLWFQGALLFLGVALTIGATMLLAWAANGPDASG